MSEYYLSALFYIWGWSPVLAGLFIFGVDFLVVILLRILLEKKFYWGKWWSFKFGDSLILPLYFIAGALLMQTITFPTHTIYDHVWWHVLTASFGYISIFIIEMNLVRKKFYTVEHQFVASHIYHSAIFGLLFYLVVSVLPIILTHLGSLYSQIALASLAGHIALVIIDHWKNSLKR